MNIKLKQFSTVTFVAASVFVSAAVTGCGKSDAANAGTSDNSASGAAASAAGGALSGSNSNGTLAFFAMPKNNSLLASLKSTLNPLPDAFADISCPTYRSIGSGCATSGDNMWLAYDNCSFSGVNSWNGVQQITSTVPASCGSFPTPASNGTLTRQVVASSGASVPSSLTITSPTGEVGTVDDGSPNLKNFDGDTIAEIVNGGYGAQTAFNSSDARSSITIAHRVYTGSFDHSVTGSLSVTEASSVATSRTISGSVTVYHNLLRVIGTSTFSNVVHENICCLPVSGTIQTVFSAGANVAPTTAGLAYVGKTETLTLTGCGTASFKAVDGSVNNVYLNRCF